MTDFITLLMIISTVLYFSIYKIRTIEQETNPLYKRKLLLRRSVFETEFPKFQYFPGYYGACNEEEMKLALVKGGPLAIGFEVYDDFIHYKSGIYHHTGLQDKFNPLEVRFKSHLISNLS